MKTNACNTHQRVRICHLMIIFCLGLLLAMPPAEIWAKGFGGGGGSRGGSSGGRSYSSSSARSSSGSSASTKGGWGGTTRQDSSASSGGGGWGKTGVTGSPSSGSARSATDAKAMDRQQSKQSYQDYKQRTGQTPSKESISQAQTRASQTRTTRVNNYFGPNTTYQRRLAPTYYQANYWGGYGYPMWGFHSVGIWDMAFLMMASDLFWYHHWNSLSQQRNMFDQQQMADMERRVKALEAKGVPRDPNFVDPNVDPDIQYSKEYVEQNPDKVFAGQVRPVPAREPKKDSGWGAGTYLFLALLCFGAWFIFIRRS
ncbi:MAG: hypothetical protein HQK58_09925 [Deltaproteobacteria bacterium]|nr:hypothetical protein [Deltaproteobacteria bacterium]